eukprot:3404446-Ditylum_brightwellii.AAC.1
MVCERRRLIMKRKDEMRKRHGLLRRMVFPSADDSSDDDDDDGNTAARFWSRLRSSTSFLSKKEEQEEQKSSEQFEESLRRRLLENLQLDINGLHVQLVGKSSQGLGGGSDGINRNNRRSRRQRRGSLDSKSSLGSATQEASESAAQAGRGLNNDYTTADNGFVLGIVLEKLSIETIKNEEQNEEDQQYIPNGSNRSLFSTASSVVVPTCSTFAIKTVRVSGLGIYIGEETNITVNKNNDAEEDDNLFG